MQKQLRQPYLLAILLGILIPEFGWSQVVNYSIDPSFNTGEFFINGKCREMAALPNGNIAVIGDYHSELESARGFAIINSEGEVVYNEFDSDEGPVFVKSMDSNLLLSERYWLDLLDNQGMPIGEFDFLYDNPEHIGLALHEFLNAKIINDEQIAIAGRFFPFSTDGEPEPEERQLCMMDPLGNPILEYEPVHCMPYYTRIMSVDQLSNGQLIISGDFTHVNGHESPGVARLNADFSVDTDFQSEFIVEFYDEQIQVQVDMFDRIWVICKDGVLAGGLNENVRLRRLSADGSVDLSWENPTFYQQYGNVLFGVSPTCMIVEPDSTVIVGGNFEIVNGEERHTLAQFDNEGNVIDDAFTNLGADAALWENWEPSIGSAHGRSVEFMEKTDDGKLLIGGQFSSFGGEPYHGIVRLTPDGIVGTDNPDDRLAISLFPNPCSDWVQLTTDSSTPIANTIIFDASGKQVWKSDSLPANHRINTTSWASGLYYAVVSTRSGRKTVKFVKE